MSYREFFDSELIPLVRRMADRPRPDDSDDAERRETREMVWQGLVELGALATSSQREWVERAELLGSALYQGPLFDTISAAELLRHNNRADLAAATFALAVRGDGADSPATPGPLVIGSGGATVDGRRAFVGFASEVDYLLVVGDNHGDTVIAVVPRSGVTLRRHEEPGGGELFDVALRESPVIAWLDDAGHWPRVLADSRVRQAAYLVGLAQGALDLAVGYAKERRQFGRPIGRFQALAFRLSELHLRIQGARLLVHAAAHEADLGNDHRLSAAQCLATAATLAQIVTTAGMQIHGAAGMVNQSDAQVYYRRAAVEAQWLGTPTQLRSEALPLLATHVA